MHNGRPPASGRFALRVARRTLPPVLAVTHTITSAAAGTAVPSVPFAFGIALLLHLLLDTFLHWNFYRERCRPIAVYGALDLAAGLALTFLILGERALAPPVLAAVLGGALPDIWTMFHAAPSGRPRGFHRFHDRLQLETTSIPRGLMSQGVAIALALAILV